MRGRKNRLTLTEQLTDINEQIQKTSGALKTLKAQKKVLENKILNQDKEQVLDAFEKSGKSVSEVINYLNGLGKAE